MRLLLLLLLKLPFFWLWRSLALLLGLWPRRGLGLRLGSDPGRRLPLNLLLRRSRRWCLPCPDLLGGSYLRLALL